MTFASRMQHHIYGGPMKRPIEWSLRTVLAPWALRRERGVSRQFWYPYTRAAMLQTCSTAVGTSVPQLGNRDRRGWTDIRTSARTPADFENGMRALQEVGIWQCVKERPSRLRRRHAVTAERPLEDH